MSKIKIGTKVIINPESKYAEPKYLAEEGTFCNQLPSGIVGVVIEFTKFSLPYTVEWVTDNGVIEKTLANCYDEEDLIVVEGE